MTREDLIAAYQRRGFTRSEAITVIAERLGMTRTAIYRWTDPLSPVRQCAAEVLSEGELSAELPALPVVHAEGALEALRARRERLAGALAAVDAELAAVERAIAASLGAAA